MSITTTFAKGLMVTDILSYNITTSVNTNAGTWTKRMTIKMKIYPPTSDYQTVAIKVVRFL